MTSLCDVIHSTLIVMITVQSIFKPSRPTRVNYVTMSKVLYLTAFSFTKITQQQDQFSWKQRSYGSNTYKIVWSKILIITKFENSMGESHFLVDGIPTQLIILLVSFYHQLSCSLNEMFQSSCFFQILSSAVWLGGFSYILT